MHRFAGYCAVFLLILIVHFSGILLLMANIWLCDEWKFCLFKTLECVRLGLMLGLKFFFILDPETIGLQSGS